MNVLQVDSVRKILNGNLLLSDIFIECKTGEVVAILGRNGCGKSTLLRIIFGTDSAENKFIKIGSEIINTITDEIKYLPQDSFLPLSFKVSKAIRLMVPGRMSEFYDDDLISRIKNDRIKNLSGGELRYLEVKLLLFSDCKFVLMDEPFSNLAPVLVEKIIILIKEELKSKGIIITDHNYREVIELADKLYVLKGGATSRVTSHNSLVDAGYINYKMDI